MIAPNAFRHYDIRGKITHELPIAQMYTLGRAFAAYVLQKNPQAKRIIVGKDGRTHSPEIHQQLVQALFDSGFHIDDTGICPTPLVYFATHAHAYDAAVMVTASHNGPEYNGLKMCLGKNSIWGDEIQEIQKLYRQQAQSVARGVGVYQRVLLQQEYCEYMAAAFSDLKTFDKPILADCGNGAVGALLRDVLEAVGLSTVSILCESVDGTYPNHLANPVELENMLHVIDEVKKNNAFLAVGFDGDGDRMAAITQEGELLAGDHLLSLFAIDVLSRRPGAKIIFDSKCLLMVPDTVKKYGGHCFRSPSGHSIIKTAMREHGALLGGELSCHFFFADEYFGYDDGIYAFLRLVRLVHTQQKSLTRLVSQFAQTHSVPEMRLFCEDDKKAQVIENIKQYLAAAQPSYTLSCEDGIRFENHESWGLVRVSNTQPALCIRYESLTPQGLQAIKELTERALAHACKDLHIRLPEQNGMHEHSIMKEIV